MQQDIIWPQKEVLIDGTTQTKLENLKWMNGHKNAYIYIVWFHLFEVSLRDNSTVSEIMSASQSLGTYIWEEFRLIANCYRVSFSSDENGLERWLSG